MIGSSHPMGNANVRQAMLAFAEANLLEYFITSLALFESTWLWQLSQIQPLRELRRRHFPSDLRPFTHCKPARELLRLTLSRLGRQDWIQHEQGWASVDQIFRALDRELSRQVGRRNLRAVYCYEDGALDSFRSAKKQGLVCFYDYPVAHWRRVRSIMEEESDLHPEWVSSMPSLKDSPEKRERKDEELLLADRIYVASAFSKNSLESFPFSLAPVVINPYGAPTPSFEFSKSPLRCAPSGPLKILFVGGLHQMKGLSYLLEAKKFLGDQVTLTLIGAPLTKECKVLNKALESHHWISTLPHGRVLEQMRAHDVFVFPSLTEGFGMVITEALSQGLPVITTPHTCGPDVISDGVEGFIVPIRNAQAIAEKIELLLHDPARLAAMSEAAKSKARKMTWQAYRERLLADVTNQILPLESLPP